MIARTKLLAFAKRAYSHGKTFTSKAMHPGERYFYLLSAILALSLIIGVSSWFMLFTQTFATTIFLGVLAVLWSVVTVMGVRAKRARSYEVLSPFYLAGMWSAALRMGPLSDKSKLGKLINPYRSWLRGTIREYTGVTILFILLVIPLTNFTLFQITHQIFSSPGDATTGFLWIDAFSHSIDPTAGFTTVVNYPFGQDIGGWTLISYLMYWLPMRFLSFFLGPIAAMNIIMLYAYTSAGVAMYWLIKRITNRRALAFFAGYAVAFVPYAMLKSVGHFSYIFSAIFPLLVGVFVSLWTRPTRKKAVLFGILAAVPFYTDGYFMLMAAVLYVSMVVTGLLSFVTRQSRKMLRQYALYMGIAFATLVVLLTPLLIIQKIDGASINSRLQNNRSDIVGEIHSYRSNVADFFLPPSNSSFLKDNTDLTILHGYNNQRSNGSENNDFISPVLYIFAIAAVVSAAAWVFKKKWSSISTLSSGERTGLLILIGVCVIGALLALATMFSPEIIVHGVRIPLPGELLIKFNIALWRVLSRLFVLFNVLIVILGSVGIWLLTRGKGRYGKVLYLPILIVCAVVTVYFYAQNFVSRPYDFRNALPETYYWLKDQKDIHSIAELPIVDPLDGYSGDYVTAQIVHGKNLINLKDSTNIRLNNAMGTLKNPEVANLLRDRGADAVITRTHGACDQKMAIGKLMHAETNVKYYDIAKQQPTKVSMCVYEVSKTKTDPAFVRFDKGFNPSANAPDQSQIVMQAGANGWMTVTDDSFTKPYTKKVRLSGTIHNTSGVGTGWAIKDEAGKILASGKFSRVHREDDAKFTIVLNNRPHVNLVITGRGASGIELAKVHLSDVVATAVDN